MKPKFSSLDDLFITQLKDMYYCEKHITKSFSKMAKKADSEDLKATLESHQNETEEHAERLEQVFEELGLMAKTKKCPAMDSILDEGKEMMEESAEPAVRDAGLIAVAQKVEHYEIASYGCLKTYAQLLGYEKAVELLEKTLEEEKATDQKLSKIAESHINIEAAGRSGKEGVKEEVEG